VTVRAEPVRFSVLAPGFLRAPSVVGVSDAEASSVLPAKVKDYVGAFADFALVKEFCDRILVPGRDDVDALALWTAAVVFYTRCFISGARSSLPGRIEGSMTVAERRVHDRTIQERHKMVAHVEIAREEIVAIARVEAGGPLPTGHHIRFRRFTHDPDQVRELRDLADGLCRVLSPVVDGELAKMPGRRTDNVG
jgi:hypothetical protein